MFKGTPWIGASLVLLMLLSGCGAANNAPVNNVSENVNTEKEEVTSGAETPAEQERVVTDEMGNEVTIPADTSHIIGIYLEDELVSLGLTPIRKSRIGAWSGQDYLGLTVEDIDVQGDVEAFVKAEPDLILTNVYEEKQYEQLSKVAPMYAFKDARADWRSTIRTLGDLLGKADKASEVIASYDQKAADAAAELKAAVGDETVAILRVHAKELRLYGGPGYAGPVLYNELQLKPAKLVQELVLDKNEKVVGLSMELIPQLDADHIFLTVDTGAEEQSKQLIESELWKSLPAVKKGQVHEVNFETWMKSGPIADGKKIEDVVAALSK
ncbi:ABC transporter substrate-binding protein [Paenibacillus sinopodophylli]|uniref:ABC transporter substrate-binding protein n=1 Tax=Paenibacillus sinopodophylli TaxID=1837342 RepID=UPI00110CDBE4|nr:ABC transporter substrate-binding protein [Paenibacillus sinopodophylli]